MKSILFLSFLLIGVNVFAQHPKNDLVQFSGVVVTADSLKPIPFASIMIKNSNRGTVSDYYGFFSLVAKLKDTIEFSAIGYKRASYIVSDTITDFRCSIIQILKSDTVQLHEALVLPWPTIDQFKEAFLALRVHDDDLDRAKKNMNPKIMYNLSENMPMDGAMNFRYTMQQQSTRIYYAGQVPVDNWLNPVAWAKFIEAWQNGEFKSKDKDKQ